MTEHIEGNGSKSKATAGRKKAMAEEPHLQSRSIKVWNSISIEP